MLPSDLLQKKEIVLQNTKATFYTINQSRGPLAHFMGGNGMPVGCYSPLLHHLKDHFDLTSLAFRGSWPNAPRQNRQVKWSSYADDLILFLETHFPNRPIIGIGHSQGANATIVAAYKRPDLFQKLFLFDPVCVTRFEQNWIGLVPYFFKKYFEPFKSSLKKKNIWKSPEEYYTFLRDNKGYKRISDEHLKIMATQSLSPKAEGTFGLLYPRDWETANYALPTNITKPLKNLKVPYQIVLGKPSMFVNQKVRDSWMVFAKDHITINPQFGHLIPLEAPQYCADQVLQFLKV